MNLRSFFALLLGLALAVPAANLAQEGAEEGMSQEEMMQAMMKLAEPGEHHKHLAMMEGDWTYELKSWTPGVPEPTESTGTVSSKWILGGRFLWSEWKGEYLGVPFQGIATDGYDKVNEQYTGTWMDSMSTGVATFSGDCEDSGKVRTMHGEFTEPMSGQKIKSKGVTTILGDGSYKYESFMVMPDGSEFKNMEIVAKRK